MQRWEGATWWQLVSSGNAVSYQLGLKVITLTGASLPGFFHLTNDNKIVHVHFDFDLLPVLLLFFFQVLKNFQHSEGTGFGTWELESCKWVVGEEGGEGEIVRLSTTTLIERPSVNPLLPVIYKTWSISPFYIHSSCSQETTMGTDKNIFRTWWCWKDSIYVQ